MDDDTLASAAPQAPSNPGEVSGALLFGLTQAFYNLAILPEENLQLRQSTVDPEQWYPYDLLIETLHRIKKAVPVSSDIFFRAGMHFLDFWYEHGPGKTMIFSGMDWLNANNASDGYNSVVRGGAPEQIGWCLPTLMDIDAGVAIYENVMPMNSDFVAGLFYRGCMLFDDMDFVTVDAQAECYPPNPAFTRILITVKFKLKPTTIVADLNAQLDALSHQESMHFTPAETTSLLWRYKNTRHYDQIEAKYFNEINSLLASNVEQLHVMQEGLIRAEKMAALGGLVAGIAHELNTPVGLSMTMTSQFQYMLDQLEARFRGGQLEESDFEQFLTDSKEISHAITLNLKRTADLIRSFKLVAVDQAHDDLRSFQPAQYIRDILLTFHQPLKLSGVETVVACDEALTLQSFAGAWSQIISNFINNSLTHGFTDRTDQNAINLSVHVEGNDALLIYQDNGCGMSPEVAEQVFDPFFTTNRQGGNSGLGMNIVFNLVTQKLKGQIELETAPEQGVKFTLRMPLTLANMTTTN